MAFSHNCLELVPALTWLINNKTSADTCGRGEALEGTPDTRHVVITAEVRDVLHVGL